ncbi:uncharacterized protein CIMG_01367 [Coccidioides immitis RS]|uniref:Uncharacterized protein n=4 Tax=Coccidioides immitis TaxID=5501 RepID=J3KJ20_COCIM|nr:uncharacterized protein CIMG_01367 [Coccidioides immitis RS]EAS36013.3 hypothetical protein CIMG_01367 [Coccidioides immitis RS]KMP01314.1 hypothetical protein CIRG_01454 [Coccidioides immitis RMSCC 2394]KMU83819.1 hypothetical protein CIHG_01603 [Coccidioides immitis H538.4]TPX25808.1 hypothetical protein DIZ76_011265 [Coccidioides immitis]
MATPRCQSTDSAEPCAQLSIDLLNSVNNTTRYREPHSFPTVALRRGQPRRNKPRDIYSIPPEDSSASTTRSVDMLSPPLGGRRRLRRRATATNPRSATSNGGHYLRSSPRKRRTDTSPTKLPREAFVLSDASSDDERVGGGIEDVSVAEKQEEEDIIMQSIPRRKSRRAATNGDGGSAARRGTYSDPDTSYQPSDEDGDSENEVSTQDQEHNEGRSDLQINFQQGVSPRVEAESIEIPDEMEDIQQVDELGRNLDDGARSFSDVESNYGLGDDEYFVEASHVFEQEKNWSALISEARELIKEANSKRIGVYSRRSIRLLGNIWDAREIYTESMGVRQDRDDDSQMTAKENEILQTISARIMKLQIRKPANLEDEQSLLSTVHEIHGYIIPAAIGLLQNCLMAHFLEGRLSDKGIDQLVQILRLFSEVCDHTNPSDYPPSVQFPDRLKTVRILFRFLLYVFQTQQGKK